MQVGLAEIAILSLYLASLSAVNRLGVVNTTPLDNHPASCDTCSW